MNNKLYVVITTLAVAAIIVNAQQTPPAGAGAGRGTGEGQGRGQAGRGAGQQQAPAVPSISQRPTGAGLGTIRVGAADNNLWFGWRVAMPAAAIKGLTLSEALAKSDLMAVTSVEASSAQIVSPEIPKKLDARLQTGERNAITYRLRELNQQILAYSPGAIGADDASRRNVFEFAKALNAATIIVPSDTSALADLDKLAEEFGINVAIESKTDPKATVSALEGRSKRLGIAADLSGWMQAGIKPVDGLAAVKDRLLLVKAADRTALGAKGRPVVLGEGAGGLGDFFLAAFNAGIKPLSIVIESSGTTEADMLKNLNGFEKVMWPAMSARVNQMLETPAGKIRGPDLLNADMKAQIDAATPRQAIVKPAKPRKMLVTDIQMYSGHSTIPHGNYLLEQMAKYTGAFEPTFSNDLSLLKYPKIKEFDAIYFNNVCGMVHNDPEVREGILRFVREGGGIGGHHAVTFSNNNWPEFAEMMGGWAGAHHIEKQLIKVDDPNSPLTKSFGPASFEHTDEFYQFPVSSPYSREKQHVLLSIDVEKSDRATANRFCAQCTRPDQDYGLAWIKTYGKGRTYFTPLGHTEIFYTDQRWTQHLLAAIQYILGDLNADATPSAKLRGQTGVRPGSDQGQTGVRPQPYSTWSDYGGSADSMQYSSLTQITKANVSRLELAWFSAVPDRKGNFGFNPVIVDKMMYVLGPSNSIVALDAATGKQIWAHAVDGGSPGNRGINYWESKDRSARRLIFGAGGTLRAIDALTGEPISSFGVNGRVNMREGPLRPLGGPSGTPGRVFENLFITGSTTGELFGSPPGDLRAYDVVTGKLVWTFHTIPHPGEFGYDTWPQDAYQWAGGANAWGELSVDDKRGIAYIPLGSPTHDSFGGDRKGANLFGNCLLALDARTGKRLWHFQTVHHDLWDYDLTTAPKLLTIRRSGQPVDIVAQPTKSGFLYVFERVTGQPIWPIEERRVPKTDVPGEESWPTQPFPTNPPPFARQKFAADEINPYLDEAEQARLRTLLQNARNEGLFTPQTLDREQISVPGEFGGANWGGSAADPTTGMLYVRASDQPAIHQLRKPGDPRSEEGGPPSQRGRAVYSQRCETCHGPPEPSGIRSMDRSVVINLKSLGEDRIRKTIRSGQNQMPAFDPAVLTDRQLDALLAYLADPVAGASGSGSGAPPPPPLPTVEGVTRYFGPLGTLFRAANGLPAISPPWAQIVAYDLNEGTIKWRVPLGTVRALAAKGIKDTGSPERIHRNGLVVTAGGLIFVGTWGDGILRAFDKDTGNVLWEHQLDANPEGLPAVYEVGGRQYVVFCASGSGAAAPPGNIAFVPGKSEAQGYYAFALKK